MAYINNNVNENHLGSYERLSDEAIVCGLDSQLLYEAMALGYRTAFFSIRGHYINDNSLNFSWPNKTAPDGFFWSNKPDKAKFYKIEGTNVIAGVEESDYLETLYEMQEAFVEK